MRMKKKKDVRKFRKNFNTRIIKSKHSYDIHEIAQLLAVNKSSIWNWLKQGLKKEDNQQPYLIWGQDLKDFLASRNKQRKRPCKENELFCCKCQQPTKPKDNCVLLKIDNTRINMVGVCEVCGSSTYRTISPTAVDTVKKVFVVKPVERESLLECNNTSATTTKN